MHVSKSDPNILQTWHWERVLVWVVVMMIMATHVELRGDAMTDRRIRSGLRIFKAMLAADEKIAGKRTADDDLLLLLVHEGNEAAAAQFAEELRSFGKGEQKQKIRDIPYRVETTEDVTLASYSERKPAGIYLTEDLRSSSLKSIIDYGIRNHVVVYSPFEGHVEKGVMGGLAIEANVRPYVNARTLRSSEISVKSFFMKIAKIYE